MKKIAFAAMTLLASGTAFASGAAETYTGVGAASMTAAKTVSSNYIYTVSGTALANRFFVKNDFNFTLSANTIIQTDEDAEGRYMGVATTNARGRNIFTGNSDGGSVTNCGDPLTAEEAKEAGAAKHISKMAARFDADLVTASSCNPTGA